MGSLHTRSKSQSTESNQFPLHATYGKGNLTDNSSPNRTLRRFSNFMNKKKINLPTFSHSETLKSIKSHRNSLILMPNNLETPKKRISFLEKQEISKTNQNSLKKLQNKDTKTVKTITSTNTVNNRRRSSVGELSLLFKNKKNIDFKKNLFLDLDPQKSIKKENNFFISPLVKQIKTDSVQSEYGIKFDNKTIIKTRKKKKKSEEHKEEIKIVKKTQNFINENKTHFNKIDIGLNTFRSKLDIDSAQEHDDFRSIRNNKLNNKNSIELNKRNSDLQNENNFKSQNNEYFNHKNNETDDSMNSSLIKNKKEYLNSAYFKNNLQNNNNNNNNVCITVHKENAKNMKKNLNQMDLEKLILEKNLQLAKGQIKYIKNGRIYIFNLNENAIIHKNKILQIVHNEDFQKTELENTDVFNELIRKKIIPTEYFCKKNINFQKFIKKK